MLRRPLATETHEDFSEPILPGKGASDYERYLRTDELLALQKSPDEQVHPDELLFQTVHQSSELWLKLGTSEVARATVHLRAGELAAALRLLTRASLCLQFITRQLDMLERMSPWEYQIVRRVLGHGSGFDSPGFRDVRRVTPPLGEAFEAAVAQAGLDLVEVYVQGRDHEELYQLAEALVEWDERITMWRIRHYKVVSRIIGDQVVRRVLGHGSGFDSPGFRDVRRVTPPLGEAFEAAVAQAGLDLVEVYVQGRDHEELYQLAEALVEWDERITMWRIRHYKVVSRIIGDQVVGTQGTPVEVLGKMIHHNFFPALWRARNQLTARSKEEEE